ASLATYRKEVEPAEQRALARLLPAWQGVDVAPPQGAGEDRLREALVPLQGVALTAEVWERDLLPRRVGAYSPTWIDSLCAGGELVWIGAGALGRHSGKVALYFRDDVRWLGPPPAPGVAADPGSLVADRPAVRRSARARAAHAGGRRDPARALRDRHPRDRARGGDSRRLRGAVRRARQARDARHRAARLFRRGPGGRPVRPAGCDRAPARPAVGRARRGARAGRHRSREPLRRLASLAAAAGPGGLPRRPAPCQGAGRLRGHA